MSIVLTLILLVAVIVAGLVWFAANTARKVEAAVPPCDQFMEIDGQRLHYIDTKGTGPAIVMIHGLGGTLWNSIIRPRPAGWEAIRLRWSMRGFAFAASKACVWWTPRSCRTWFRAIPTRPSS
jgi:hypothetical protein